MSPGRINRESGPSVEALRETLVIAAFAPDVIPTQPGHPALAKPVEELRIESIICEGFTIECRRPAGPQIGQLAVVECAVAILVPVEGPDLEPAQHRFRLPGHEGVAARLRRRFPLPCQIHAVDLGASVAL